MKTERLEIEYPLIIRKWDGTGEAASDFKDGWMLFGEINKEVE